MLTLFFIEKWKREQKAHKSFLHNFLPKSILGFEKWTKKMSKNENRKHFSEKNLAYTDIDVFAYSFC
jgi:hypothetical protein